MHSFEVHSNESACRKKVRLGLEQVIHTFEMLTNCILAIVIILIAWFGGIINHCGKHMARIVVIIFHMVFIYVSWAKEKERIISQEYHSVSSQTF